MMRILSKVLTIRMGISRLGDNTYMYKLDNNIIKITNINNVNDTKIITTVK